MSIAYRKEVDGLRAIAVMAVVLFHAGFQQARGGFIGVDVFFVISGFLITSIILTESASGNFTISGFYERRARRILPALFTVVLVSVAIAYKFLLPDDFIHFGKSVAAASVFSSNIFFWWQDDYFAPAAEDMPLLHTWTLAVEEQYYLLFPLLLLLLVPSKRPRLIIGVAAVALVSLALAQWGSRYAPSANFYLLPSRAWELMVGALVALLLIERDIAADIGVTTRNLLSLAGLTMVIGSFLFLDEQTPLPSLYSIIPVAGTALLLIAATSNTWVGKVLGSKPFVLVGLISYSIYLWHVPLLSFAKVILPEPPGLGLKLFLLAATFILALATWKFIETPFRRRRFLERRTVLIGAAVVSVVFAAGGTVIALNDGFRDRFSSYYLTFNKGRERRATWRHVREHMRQAAQAPSVASQTSASQTPPFKIAVLGNSHGKDMFNALYLTGVKADLEPVITNRLCGKFPQGTARTMKCWTEYIGEDHQAWDADRYIIAPKWTDELIAALPTVLDRFAELGKPVAVFGNTAEFVDVPQYFAKSIRLLGDETEPTLRRIERQASRTLRTSALEDMNRRIRKIAEDRGAVYFDRMSLLCTPERECTLLGDGLKHLLYDYGHTTMRGAKYVASRLLSNEKFVEFVSPPTRSGEGPPRSRKAANEGG